MWCNSQQKNTGPNSRLLKRQHHHRPTQPVRLIRSTHHFIFLARFCRGSCSGCRGNRALRPCHPAQAVGSTIFEDGMETFQMKVPKTRRKNTKKRHSSTFPVEGGSESKHNKQQKLPVLTWLPAGCQESIHQPTPFIKATEPSPNRRTEHPLQGALPWAWQSM